jgi:DNA polymerase III epsilon subunit-like protein
VNSYVVIDLETGGVDPRRHPILSISAVRVEGDTVGTYFFRSLVIPPEQAPIEAAAIKVNGYDPELWATSGFDLARALTMLQRWRKKGEIAVAHNAGFDREFLRAAEEITGVKTYVPYKWVCTMAGLMWLDHAHDLRLADHKLDTLGSLCGFWPKGQRPEIHEGLSDAKCAAYGFVWLRRSIREGRVAPPVTSPDVSLELPPGDDASRLGIRA